MFVMCTLNNKICLNQTAVSFKRFNYQNAEDKIFVSNFSKYVKSKLYYMIQRANSVDLDELFSSLLS